MLNAIHDSFGDAFFENVANTRVAATDFTDDGPEFSDILQKLQFFGVISFDDDAVLS